VKVAANKRAKEEKVTGEEEEQGLKACSPKPKPKHVLAA
jgi:hypothetical protein